jgi:DNA-binding transcriptional LysR family regulator
MAEHHFDLALLSSVEDTLPPAWVRVSVGPVRRALFAPKALSKRLGPLPVSVEKVRSVPFVVPVHDTDGRFLAGEDDCPLPIRDRTIGHEAQSIGTALELAARTEQLVFCPTMSARPYVEAGWLVEVPVEGWAVEDPLFVACDGNRVMSQTLKRVVAALEVAVAEKDPSPPSRRRG